MTLLHRNNYATLILEYKKKNIYLTELAEYGNQFEIWDGILPFSDKIFYEDKQKILFKS